MHLGVKLLAIFFLQLVFFQSYESVDAEGVDFGDLSSFGWTDSNWGRLFPTIISGIESTISNIISNLTSTLSGIGGSGSGSGLGGGEKPNIGLTLNNLVTSFVNQTRQTIPLVARHSNFTMIQIGLLFAIGAMAAGAGVIVAEAAQFRQRETDLENYNKLKSQHAASRLSTALGTYSDDPNAFSYGNYPYDTPESPYNSYNYNYNSNLAPQNRKKRDTGSSSEVSYPFITKPYSRRRQSAASADNRYQADLQNQNTPQNYDFDQIALFSNIQSQSQKPNFQFQNSYYQPRPQFAHETNPYLYENRLGMKRKSGAKRRISSPGISEQVGETGTLADQDMEYTRGLLSFDPRSFTRKNGLYGKKVKYSRRNHDDAENYHEMEMDEDNSSFESLGRSDLLENNYYADAAIYDAPRKHRKQMSRRQPLRVFSEQ